MASDRFISTPEGNDAEHVNLDDIKVLVVDDSKTILRSAELYLKEKGCEVRTVEDGFQSLSIIDDYQPDIIFLDIMMPRLDGYQTCAMIKSNEEYADIPVIMLSSKHNLFDKARGRLSGSEEYLTKPFSHDDLISAINTHTHTQTDDAEKLPEEFLF
ncbi:MAG: twitching motility protein PilG [uncultured Thiotrichaceae bacterium]|uniref:Twitching motility protein PilG n=1 Tax=uncultured Thiotrichaceae bacterium TaxID=298394 RepID=A0A6S6U3F0_9GAMM|nr:MAG: twitching motility protein PilG [uncultured Thiotrichaceae bacterium]